MKVTAASAALLASALVLPALAVPLPADSQINETRDLSVAVGVEGGLEMRDILASSSEYQDFYSRELDDAMVEDILARMLEESGLDARDLAELQEREPFFFLSKLFKIGRKVGGAIHSAVQNRKNKRELSEEDEEMFARELVDADLQEREPFFFLSKLFKIGRKVGGAIHSAVQNRKNKRDLGDIENDGLFARELDFDELFERLDRDQIQDVLSRRGVELLDELD